MANHGTDPRTRMRLLRERFEAMQAIWTQQEASYHCRFIDVDRIWSWPKPLQRIDEPRRAAEAGRATSRSTS